MRGKIYVQAAIIIFFVFNLKAQSQKRFKFYDDFNLGAFGAGWRNQEITKNNGYKIDTVSKSGRNRDGFLKTIVRKSGDSVERKRSEFGVKLYDSILQTKFLSFSVRIPNTYILDKDNLGKENVICQWHSKPAPGDDWEDYKENIPFNRPNVALFIITNDNKDYYLVLRYGNNSRAGKNKLEDYVWSTIALKKIELNKWYDLVFEIKWSFTNTGYIASWINNKPFTPFNGLHNKVYGPNMHNVSPPYFKFGQYRFWDDSHQHDIDFDELRIGDSFEEVSKNYDSLPKMFLKNSNLKFIKNHY